MTVGVIRQAALHAQDHYSVRRFLEHVCGKLRSKDYVSEYLAWYNFLWANTRYMRDPRTVELVRAPEVVIDQLAAGETPSLDCDDLTALLIAGCLAIGGQCAAVTLAFRHQFYLGQRQFSHVCAQVIEPRSGAAIILDPVANLKTRQMLNRAVAAKVWPVA